MRSFTSRRLLTTLAVLSLLTMMPPRTEAAPVVIFNRTINIEPGHFYTVPFLLTHDSTVMGNVRAAGTSDVEVFIFDNAGLEKFRNGQTAETYYSAGRINKCFINLKLKQNQYHLVVSNVYSLLKTKTAGIVLTVQ